jgi:CBS domain-containing protein
MRRPPNRLERHNRAADAHCEKANGNSLFQASQSTKCELQLQKNKEGIRPRHFIYEELDVFTASEIMKLPVVKVTPDTSVDDAVELMLKHNLSGVPVVDSDGQLVGMFSETDQFDCGYADQAQARVADYMTTDVTSLDVADPLVDVAQAFKAKPVHRMPVTRDGTVVGVIGCRDLAQFVRKLEKEFQMLSQLVTCPDEADLLCDND